MEKMHELYCMSNRENYVCQIFKISNESTLDVLTSITACSIKLVPGLFEGFFNFNSFFPRVIPSAKSCRV